MPDSSPIEIQADELQWLAERGYRPLSLFCRLGLHKWRIYGVWADGWQSKRERLCDRCFKHQRQGLSYFLTRRTTRWIDFRPPVPNEVLVARRKAEREARKAALYA